MILLSACRAYAACRTIYSVRFCADLFMQFCHLSVSQCVILIGLTLFRSLVLSDNSWVINLLLGHTQSSTQYREVEWACDCDDWWAQCLSVLSVREHISRTACSIITNVCACQFTRFTDKSALVKSAPTIMRRQMRADKSAQHLLKSYNQSITKNQSTWNHKWNVIMTRQKIQEPKDNVY